MKTWRTVSSVLLGLLILLALLSDIQFENPRAAVTYRLAQLKE